MNPHRFEPYDDEPSGTRAGGFTSGGSIEFLNGAEGFSGAISLPLLPDLIQIYTVSLADGALTIRRGTELGTIWFSRGEMVHAVCQDKIGEEAVYQLLKWQNGQFSLDADAHPPERSITASWQKVLMEGCRLLDENGGSTEAEDALEQLEQSLDGFQSAAVLSFEGSVLAQRTRNAFDFSSAAPFIVEFVRNAGATTPLADVFSIVGGSVHRIEALRGGRLLYVVVENRAFNVAVIRRAVESVAARLL